MKNKKNIKSRSSAMKYYNKLLFDNNIFQSSFYSDISNEWLYQLTLESICNPNISDGCTASSFGDNGVYIEWRKSNSNIISIKRKYLGYENETLLEQTIENLRKITRMWVTNYINKYKISFDRLDNDYYYFKIEEEPLKGFRNFYEINSIIYRYNDNSEKPIVSIYDSTLTHIYEMHIYSINGSEERIIYKYPSTYFTVKKYDPRY